MTGILRITPVAGGLEQLAADDRAYAITLLSPPDDPVPVPRRRHGQPPAQIRRWATVAGVPCPWTGPIPTAVRAAYDAAHPEETTDGNA